MHGGAVVRAAGACTGRDALEGAQMPYIDHRTLVTGFHEPARTLVNRRAGAADGVAMEWVRRLGLATGPVQERLAALDLGTATGAALPDVGLAELRLAQQARYWFALLEDRVDGAADAVEVIRAARAGAAAAFAGRPAAADEPLSAGLADLCGELSRCCPPPARHRLGDRFLEYLDGLERRAGHAAAGSVPGLLEFVAMRRATSGVPAWAELLDAALGLHLPEEVRGHYLLREIVDCAADVSALGTDIRGYERQAADGQAGTNAVTVLAQAFGCPTGEAVVRALAMHRERQRALLAAERQLPGMLSRLGLAGTAADTGRLVSAVKAGVFGLHYWFACDTGRRDGTDLPRTRGALASCA
jgi:hypothetical protein